MTKIITKKLVVTGFHRTATSATANYLNNAGLDMGSNLMLANISNVKGHFEDLPIVKLHNDVLRKSSTSWQYHGEVTLDVNSNFLAPYITSRNRKQMCWGVKDPRACLFLEQWNEQLGKDGAFLLIIRHWSSCIESLFHRHSRELAFNLTPVEENNQQIQFWNKPDLAAKMWLEYNKRLLSFALKYPEKVIVCTQRGLFDGAPVLSVLNDKFKFSLNVNAVCPYQKELINDSASENLVHSLSISMRLELESLWIELLSVANIKSSNEKINYYLPPEIPDKVQADYHNYINNFISSIVDKNKFGVSHNNEKIPGNLNEEQFISWIKKCNYKFPLKLLDFSMAHYPLSSSVLVETGKVLLNEKYFNEALNIFQYVNTISDLPPFVFMLIGQCYRNLSNEKLALYFFDYALTSNPNSVGYYKVKADYLVELGELDKAKECLSSCFEMFGYLPETVISYAEILMKEDRLEDAIDLLSNISDSHPSLSNLMAIVNMQKDYRVGLIGYYELISERIRDRDKIQWLSQATYYITSSASEKDFLSRCYQHWNMLDI